jgi:alpha-aminoadipic semialdehyde synthase
MNTLLIRAEDKNLWERRAPLVPEDLKEIIKKTRVKAYLQKSEKRIFPEEDYVSAGALVCDNMDPGEVILGIKEIPEEKLLDHKVYAFFSHTTKGQKENMPMLKKIIQGGSTLIDYEKITDSQGLRQIFFGNYAGHAGTLNILHLMGQYWEHQGVATPFSLARRAMDYDSVKQAQGHMVEIGRKIERQGLNDKLNPLVIGILGYGNVAKGVQEILNCLPVRLIAPEKLPGFFEKGGADSNKVYVSVFREEHLVRHRKNRPFDLQDYYRHPENYGSELERYLPFLSILINAIYWDSRYPRFVTWESLRRLSEGPDTPKLCGIADITCDVGGSIECNVKSTDSGMPAYLCNPMDRSITDGHKGEGIVLLAIDNLPAEIPNDASRFFSNQLKAFIDNLVNADFDKSLKKSGLCPEIQRSVIVYKGELTSPYKNLERYIP